MNEQIKQKLPTPFRLQGQQISYDGDDQAFCHLYSIEQMVEFAELIVKECMAVAAEYQNVGGNCYVDNRIAKHFGVEE